MVLRNTLIDSRFSIAREFCGFASARYVLRFCGEWVGQYETRAEAEEARRLAIQHRRATLALS